MFAYRRVHAASLERKKNTSPHAVSSTLWEPTTCDRRHEEDLTIQNWDFYISVNRLSSGKLIQNYWKSPFLVDLAIQFKLVIFH